MKELRLSGLVEPGREVEACKPVLSEHVPCWGVLCGTPPDVLLVCKSLQNNPNRIGMDGTFLLWVFQIANCSINH